MFPHIHSVAGTATITSAGLYSDKALLTSHIVLLDYASAWQKQQDSNLHCATQDEEILIYDTCRLL